jgi:anti-sigma factor RsiW
MWPRHPEIVFAPYLSGELDPEESRRLQEHLAGCARCREGLADAKSVMDRLALEIDRIAEPDWAAYQLELRRKLNARRYRAPARRWSPRWAWASIATAAAATAAIVLTLALGRPRPPAVDQLALEGGWADADIGLLQDYPVVEHLDLLENYDVIENLDSLTPPEPPQHHESRPS